MSQSKVKPIVIITGAAGTIGSALKSAFQSEYQVVGFDLKGSDICIDLTSDSSVKTALNKFKVKYQGIIAAVIHLAAYFDFTGENSPLYKKVNEEGTKRFLQALQEFNVERFIFASTMLVHKAASPGEKINEQTPLEPKWAYPQSKMKTEEVIAQYHGHIPYLILRLAGLYNDETCVPTLANQISRIYERGFKSRVYAGNIHAGQSFIHTDDLINLFKQAVQLRHELPEEEIILAGEPEVVSYTTLQDDIGRLIHGEAQWKTYGIPPSIAKAGSWLEEKAEPVVPDDFDQGKKPFIRPFMVEMASDHYEPDITKANQILRWQPQHNIKDTLPKIIQSLQEKPVSWYKQHGISPPDWMLTTKNELSDKLRVEYEKKIRHEHTQNLWGHFLNISLGLWLIASPVTLNYRSMGLIYSDIISGVLIIFLGFICLSWKFPIARWLCAMVGLWLLFAPLVFWTPIAGAYLNDTLIGALVIGFAVLTRPDTGVAPNAVMTGPAIPPGWEFSPSSWFQRIPIIFLAFIGLFISRYLTAYQLEHIPHAWEPFFSGNLKDPKNGTEEIITSYVSKAWPVPDAGVGAVTYILEILTGIIGGANRWRTMPWLVLLFGIMIIPLGAVSITFIIIQPILLGTWCTLCLIAASAMLLQIPYSFDEIIATCIFLWRRHKAGRPLLKILFVGDTDEGKNTEQKLDNFEQRPSIIIKEMLEGGLSIPWTLLACIFIGVWLMFTPLTLNAQGSIANANHFIGSMVITIAITAFAEVIRPIRFLNCVFALALLIVSLIYETSAWQMATNILFAILLFIFSLPRGKINNTYGIWNKFIV